MWTDSTLVGHIETRAGPSNASQAVQNWSAPMYQIGGTALAAGALGYQILSHHSKNKVPAVEAAPAVAASAPRPASEAPRLPEIAHVGSIHVV